MVILHYLAPDILQQIAAQLHTIYMASSNQTKIYLSNDALSFHS